MLVSFYVRIRISFDRLVPCGHGPMLSTLDLMVLALIYPIIMFRVRGLYLIGYSTVQVHHRRVPSLKADIESRYIKQKKKN